MSLVQNVDGRMQLVYADGITDVSAQYPIAVDGDSVYSKDIDPDYSTKVGWTGSIFAPFEDLHTEIYNDTTTNPKVLLFYFFRATYMNAIGIGCSSGKTFSNVKIEFLGSDESVRYTYDDSANSTAYGTKLYSFPPTACVAVKFSFLTSNTVGITSITIQKEMSITSRMRALKPTQVVTDIGATNGGSLKVAISDDYDFVGYNTPMGELRTIEPVRLVGAGFEGDVIDTKFWAAAYSGSAASVAQSGSQVLMISGSSSGATASIYSVRRSRYVSGSSVRYRTVQRLGDIGTANNRRRWGVGYGASMPTITDGAWFQLDGTEFSVNTCKGGSATKVTTFNGYLGQYVPTLYATTYEIYWTNSTVWYMVGGVLLHKMSAITTTWANTMAMHIFADSLNSSVLGASVTNSIRTASIYRLGKYSTQPIYYHISGDAATHVLKLSSGVLHKIIFNNTSGTNITIVDNVTGATPVIGIITTSLSAPGTWDFDLAFNTGLILITTGNSLDATVVYE